MISMAILRAALNASPAERTAYLKHATAMRAAVNGEGADIPISTDDDEEVAGGAAISLSVDRIGELGGAEEFILTVSSEGFGKRHLYAYDYRRHRPSADRGSSPRIFLAGAEGSLRPSL